MVDLRERLDRPFNLVRWFVITGFLCIVLTAVVLSIVLSRFLEKTVVEQDAKVAMQLVNTFVRTSEARTYFSHYSYQDFDLSSPKSIDTGTIAKPNVRPRAVIIAVEFFRSLVIFIPMSWANTDSRSKPRAKRGMTWRDQSNNLKYINKN